MQIHYVISVGDDVIPRHNDCLVGFPMGSTYVPGAKGKVSTTDIEEASSVFDKVLSGEFKIGDWQIGRTLVLSKCIGENGQKIDVSNVEVLRSGVISGG